MSNVDTTNTDRKIPLLVYLCVSIASFLLLVKTGLQTITTEPPRDDRRLLPENNVVLYPSHDPNAPYTIRQPKIPHNLIFTYSHDILETKKPWILYKNIRKTINKYKMKWKREYKQQLKELNGTYFVEPPMQVIFLDDERCGEVITRAAPGLTPHFEKERFGAIRGDICRIAALYLWGGYYHDVDMDVIRPFVPNPPTLAFVTAFQPVRRDFFQSFIAASAFNVVLENALKFMEFYYQGVLFRKVDQLGTRTLKWAFEAAFPTEWAGEALLLEELYVNKWIKIYPEVPRQVGYGCCCNYAVHDPHAKVMYFYSRVVGYSNRCMSRPEGQRRL